MKNLFIRLSSSVLVSSVLLLTTCLIPWASAEEAVISGSISGSVQPKVTPRLGIVVVGGAIENFNGNISERPPNLNYLKESSNYRMTFIDGAVVISELEVPVTTWTKKIITGEDGKPMEAKTRSITDQILNKPLKINMNEAQRNKFSTSGAYHLAINQEVITKLNRSRENVTYSLEDFYVFESYGPVNKFGKIDLNGKFNSITQEESDYLKRSLTTASFDEKALMSAAKAVMTTPTGPARTPAFSEIEKLVPGQNDAGPALPGADRDGDPLPVNPPGLPLPSPGKETTSSNSGSIWEY